MIDPSTEFSRLSRAARHVRPSWGAERVEAIVRGVQARQLQRQVRASIARKASGALAIAAVAFLLVTWRPWSSPRAATITLAGVATVPAAPSYVAPASTLADDGLRVEPLDDASSITWRDSAPEHALVVVDRGGARCDITATARDVRVEAGPVATLADDAAFVVEHRGDGRVRVSVERGRVLVLWALGAADLAAGESDSFPPVVGASVAKTPSAAPSAMIARVAPRAAAADGGEGTSADDWRALARRGAYDEAFEHLRSEGGPKDEVNDLLLAADVARLGHHPEGAVAPLQQILRSHGADARASLAAFTLGRVLLTQLGQPAAAADAFATARALSPAGALAEDALAREVEARSRAGQADAARRLAEEYVRLFPESARVASVRRLVGLE